jgi:hypothetical protein
MRRQKPTALIFIILLAGVGLGAVLATNTTPQLGLDLPGGVSAVHAPTEDASEDALSQTIEIIRSRVDALGVAEPEITRQGSSVVVQLPGVKNQQRALELVGTTADIPLDDQCGCPVCARWSRSYLRHLLVVDEPTAPRLITLHNLWWTLALVSEIRAAVEAGSLAGVRSRIAAAYG